MWPILQATGFHFSCLHCPRLNGEIIWASHDRMWPLSLSLFTHSPVQGAFFFSNADSASPEKSATMCPSLLLGELQHILSLDLLYSQSWTESICCVESWANPNQRSRMQTKMGLILNNLLLLVFQRLPARFSQHHSDHFRCHDIKMK